MGYTCGPNGYKKNYVRPREGIVLQLWVYDLWSQENRNLIPAFNCSKDLPKDITSQSRYILSIELSI